MGKVVISSWSPAFLKYMEENWVDEIEQEVILGKEKILMTCFPYDAHSLNLLLN